MWIGVRLNVIKSQRITNELINEYIYIFTLIYIFSENQRRYDIALSAECIALCSARIH